MPTRLQQLQFFLFVLLKFLGLARNEMVSTKRSSSIRQEKSTSESEEDLFPGVDPMSLSVQQKIAQFRKSTKGSKSDRETVLENRLYLFN